MGLRANTNIASLTAQNSLFRATNRLRGNFARLSSGLRIFSAADDAAGLGISERMRSQIASYSVASRNAQDGISMAQVAEGALAEVSNILTRMRELALQSANGTLDDADDRATLDAEFQSLDDEINRIATSTEFNGISLLDAVGTVSIQVGIDSGSTIDVNTVDVTSATLGIDTLSVDTAANATTALAAIDLAITAVSQDRGRIGADQNRLTSALSNALNMRENLAAAESRIRDVDVAFETAALARNSFLQQAALAVLAQANAQPALVLTLLGTS